MNGTRALLDSDAIIYASKQIVDAEKLSSEHDEYYASIITFTEVYSSGFPNDAEKAISDEIFENLEIVALDRSIAEQSITYRKNPTKKIKLPDAVILATAKILGAGLITNNSEDFEKIDPSVDLVDITAYKVEAG
jgi:predicted nucleic acid-binding protein